MKRLFPTHMIYGHTSGLSRADLQSLSKIYKRNVPFSKLTTPELTKVLCDSSKEHKRQFGVLIDRESTIQYVVAGDATKLFLPELGRLRGGSGRFRGLRLIHTHLRNERLSQDDLVDLTRLRLDLVAAIGMSAQGQPRSIEYAHCLPATPNHNSEYFRTYGPFPYGKHQCDPQQLVLDIENEFAKAAKARGIASSSNRTILVHISKKRDTQQTKTALYELKELSRTAGLDVADEVVQYKHRIDPKYVIGKGKLEEIVLLAMHHDADTLIIDHDLSPAQGVNLGTFTDLKIIDRTQLILDIFAQHATTADGKLQVELAQMKYLLPRLGSKDDALSRLTGGIGGRGPGETKIEIGKRRAQSRIKSLETALSAIQQQRSLRKSRRNRKHIPSIAIIGYTNAGKSTLLNTLTQSDVLVEDKLFATLDTRARRIRLPKEREIVITDTVGFIRDLPESLFLAFRATFEEAQDANLLLHVIDASSDNQDEQHQVTLELISQLKLEHIPRLDIFNKSDRINIQTKNQLKKRKNTYVISALDRKSLAPLIKALEHRLFPKSTQAAQMQQ